jgi:hypothetical protein
MKAAPRISVWIVGGEQQDPLFAHREANDDRASGLGRVHYRNGIGCKLTFGVRRGFRRRADLPLPRPSKVITRQCRDRYGICIFHCREWMIDQVGNNKTVGSPSPNTS